MSKLFGTDGIRGIANKELTPMLAFDIARASAYVIGKKIGHKPNVIIGKDTRISGDMLESAMVSGFTSVGCDVKLLGIIPTPAVSYLVRKYKADIGVVITASHNTYEFNGIKYFSSKGIKFPDEVEQEIEDEYYNGCSMSLPAMNAAIGRYEYVSQAHYSYIDYAICTANLKRKNIKVGIDCSNGATSSFAESIFKALGLDVTVINNNPNGININYNCGSLHLESLQQLVVEKGLDVGIAFDGDGDRMLAVDDKGNQICGDRVIAIFAKYLKDVGRLKNNTFVVTVMSNLGLIKFAKESGINVIQTKVGDKYVLQEMLKGDFTFGGEQSGHMIFKDLNPTGDGIVSAIQFLSLISSYDVPVSELVKIIDIYPQVTINANVNNDHKYDYVEDVEISNAIWQIERELGTEGRILVRPSGTEPYVRVMMEGKDIDDITQKAKKIAGMIEKL